MIINKPHLKPWYLKVIETIFSLLIWSVVIYLFGIFFTAILWVFGVNHLTEQLFIVNDLDAIISLCIKGLIYTLIIMILIFAWIRWNLYYYGGLSRRKARPAITDEQVAELYHITLETLQEFRSSKIAYVLADENSSEIEVVAKLSDYYYTDSKYNNFSHEVGEL